MTPYTHLGTQGGGSQDACPSGNCQGGAVGHLGEGVVGYLQGGVVGHLQGQLGVWVWLGV